LQIQDKLLHQFPEVQSVYGKIGKSDTATDPAPMSMVETTVVLKPETAWRTEHTARWYSSWAPSWLRPRLAGYWPEDRPITWEALIEQLDRAVQIPSFSNAWLFPIRTRIDMITTGIRTPVGVKVMGPKLETIEDIGLQVEKALQRAAHFSNASPEATTLTTK
jgi:Cu(I)/Ag(I) efflux system membrane protein CusA/SilA